MAPNTVSIIVPAYNAEKILPKCLDSILSQTYKDFEVILINDGSKDRTGEVADGYVAKDDRIKVIHKTNGGVSSARNEGLKIAAGEWVTFIDADDWVEPEFIANMITGQDTDIIVGGYHSIGNGEIEERKYTSKLITGGEMSAVFKKHLTDMTFLCPWGKLFKHDIIRQNGLCFNTDMRIGEDTVFVWNYLAYCNRLSFVGGQNYNYQTEKADFKYAIDASQSLMTIKRIVSSLSILEEKYKCSFSEARYFIYNYYIWLYKLFVNKYYTLNRVPEMKTFFRNTDVYHFYRINHSKSIDKQIVYFLLNLKMEILIYMLLKIWY